MNAPTRIVADVDDATLARIESAAVGLGMTREQFVIEALRRAADEAVDMEAWLRRGREQIARGEYREHDAFMADLRAWRETRIRPH